MIPQRQPYRAVMAVFRPQNGPRRLLRVGGQNLVFTVVLPHHVEHIGQSIVVIVAHVGAEEGLRHRARGVVFVEDLKQPGQNAMRQFGVGRVVNLVASAPENDAGMVAVAADGVTSVDQGPLLKVEVVVVRVLAHRPAIEQLIHDQEAHAVAEIEKLR